MRPLGFIAFFLIPNSLIAQKATVDSIIKEYQTPFRPAIVLLFKNNSRVDSTMAKYGNLIFEGMEPGNYRIVFNAIGQPSTRKESIEVKQGQYLKIYVKLSGPCIYTYPADYVPACPKGHSDNIIPIVYGLFVIKKEYKDSIYPGGCVVSGCDPKYYCKTHKIIF